MKTTITALCAALRPAARPAALLAMLLAALPLQAQFPALPWVKDRAEAMKVGAWASYLVVDEQGAESRMRFAVVGEEQLEGRRGLWYETNIDSAEEPATIKLLLLLGEGDQWEIKRMVMKSGEGPAMELPVSMSGDSKGARGMMGSVPFDTESEDFQQSLQELGREQLTVDGKTLECMHYQVKDQDGEPAEFWVSRQVPLFSMVRYQGQQSRMELQEWGDSGAESRIKEDPQSIMGGLKGGLKGMLPGRK